MQISKANKINRRKDTRTQILNVAQEIIATEGLKALSLRKIAEKLGIQPPSLYTHFKGIDAIIEAVSLRVYGSFAQIRHELTAASPDQYLKAHINALVDHMVQNPVYIQIMLQDFSALDCERDLTERVEHKIDQSFVNVQNMLDFGAKNGAFRLVRADQYLANIFGAALISLAWSGFGKNGALSPVAPVLQIKSDLLRMAKAYLAVNP